MNGAIIPVAPMLPAMSQGAIEKVSRLEADLLCQPQPALMTHHVLHGGMYSRTIRIPAGGVITGALIKVATTLIVVGDVTVFIGDDEIKLQGYNAIPASAGRKQAFIANADTYLTMIFRTAAKTIEQAEDEFTDEAHMLLSRHQPESNSIVITGD